MVKSEKAGKAHEFELSDDHQGLGALTISHELATSKGDGSVAALPL